MLILFNDHLLSDLIYPVFCYCFISPASTREKQLSDIEIATLDKQGKTQQSCDWNDRLVKAGESCTLCTQFNGIDWLPIIWDSRLLSQLVFADMCSRLINLHFFLSFESWPVTDVILHLNKARPGEIHCLYMGSYCLILSDLNSLFFSLHVSCVGCGLVQQPYTVWCIMADGHTDMSSTSRVWLILKFAPRR